MLFDRLEVDGFSNTFANILNFLMSFLIRKTHTIVLKRESDSFIEIDGENVFFNSSFEGVLPFLNVDKKKLNVFLSAGAVVYFIKHDDKVIGYSVIRESDVDIAGIGKVELSMLGRAWIGPTFVHKGFRGKGLNKKLISHSVNYAVSKGLVPMTSANLNNIPSLKSFEKCGFSIDFIVRFTAFLGKKYNLQLFR